MRGRQRPALRVAVQLAAELRKVRQVARPAGRDRERRRAQQDERGGEWEEDEHEKHRRVHLGRQMQRQRENDETGNHTSEGDGRRTDGCPSHSLPFAFVWGFSGNARSPKYARVGEAERGRMEESSVLARLCSGEDGVDGKFCSGLKCNDCVHLVNIDANFDCGGGLWDGRGMERESAGTSFAVRGVEGIGGRAGSAVGRSTRELDRRRPRVARVSGGRTLVEDARCLLGGGKGGRRAADMARQ